MTTFLAALAALAPGLYAWFSGRRLLALIDDPTFPDQHFARSRRLGMLTIVALVLAIFLAGGGVWWTATVGLLALLTGSWPARRRLFGETWSFPRYLRTMVRAGIGMAGFWILLIWAPMLILELGEVDIALAGTAAAALAIVLAAINWDFPRFWLGLHSGSTISDPVLQPRFARILSRAACEKPRICRYGVEGGYAMNAFALPGRRESAVAFGDSLLAALDPDEVAAIFAHEVAHLEHFSAARFRRLAIATWVLVALATALPFTLAVLAPHYGIWVSLATIAAAVIVLARIGGRSQANETASDIRAADLTGDPETLVRALTKLHLHLRLPRHWPHEVEPSVSHPSLARRIQAIREHARSAGGVLSAATVVRSTHAGSRIVFDDARAYWFEGVPEGIGNDLGALRDSAASYRMLAYAELSELRLVATGTGRALRARDLAGHAWAVTIHPDDLPALQRALELVDTRLGRQRKESSHARVRVIAAALLVSLLAAGQTGIVLLPVALVLFRPGIAAMAAMGAMAIAQAAAVLVAGELAAASPGTTAGAIGMAVMGACALWLAWRAATGTRRTAGRDATAPDIARFTLDPRATARSTLLSLGLAAVVIAILVARTVGRSAPELVLADPMTIALGVTVLGGATALATLDVRHWRRTGIAVAVVGALGAMIGATRLSAALGEPLATVERTATRVGEHVLPRTGYRLDLSPGGALWAVQGVMSDGAPYAEEEDVAFRWMIGRVDAVGEPRGAGERATHEPGAREPTVVLRELAALDIAFVDDERILALAWRGDSLEVSVERIVVARAARGGADNAEPIIEWRRSLPSMFTPALLVEPANRRWTVTGRRQDGSLVAIAGSYEGGRPAQYGWPADSMWLQPLSVAADGSALAYAMNPQFDVLDAMLMMLRGPSMRADLWRLHAAGRERIGTILGLPMCRADGAFTTCVGREGSRSRLWRVAPGVGVTPLGPLPEGYDVRHLGRGGAIAAVARDGTGPLLVDAVTGQATRVLLRGGARDTRSRSAVDAQAAGSTLLILEIGARVTVVGVYRLDGAR